MAIQGNPKTRMLRGLTLYLALVAGSLVFSLPFLWMVGTSFKVDREMAKSSEISFVPEKPVPAQQSPYLDERYYSLEKIERPEVLPLIREVLADGDFSIPETARTRDETVDVMVPGVYSRLSKFMSAEKWAEGKPAIEKAVTSEVVNDVAENVVRRLKIGVVRVRSLDMHEQNMNTSMSPAEFWSVKSGEGTVEPIADDMATLVYDFQAEGKQEVVLEADLDLPFAADRLHRTQIYLTPDDSWHNLFFEVEFGGKLYRCARAQDTGQTISTVAMLQARSEDDSSVSTKIRLWNPYDEIASGTQYDHGPNGVKVRMILKESDDLDAWWAKCSRNYKLVMQYVPFWQYVRTSAFLVILNVIGNIFSCSLAAYAFARLNWPGRNISFGLMLATMMIPPQVTMIPFFLIVKTLGLYNNLTPLWIMSMFGNAFNIFLLRQFMMGIPRDLEDAAKIDGCNFMHVYWNVIIPLIKPTLACIAVFTFMGVWNDFMGPLIFLSDQRLYPLSLGLYALKVQNGNMGLMMAGSMLMTLPVILVFAFAQRYFIQGIALTGTKG